MMELKASQDVLYEGKYLRMVKREGWEYVERKGLSGIVMVLATNPAGKIILVEQYRPPLRRRLIELPAGLAGDVQGSQEEALEEAARRELLEETGYSASQWMRLGEGSVSAGLSSEVVTLFRATGLIKTGAGGGDDSEDIHVHEVPVGEVLQWLARKESEGVMIDLKVWTGLFFLLSEGSKI